MVRGEQQEEASISRVQVKNCWFSETQNEPPISKLSATRSNERGAAEDKTMNGFSCGSIAELELDRNGSRECSKGVWFYALESNWREESKVCWSVTKRALAAEERSQKSCLAEERNELSMKQIRTMHPTKDASLPLDEKMTLACARFPSSKVTIKGAKADAASKS